MNEELKVIITAEIDKLKQELQNGQKEIKKFGKQSGTSFGDFTEGVQKAGDTAKKALAVAGTAILGTATALLALASSTEEYRQNQALLKTAFETAGGSAKEATQVYNDLYRVLGDDGQAVEAGQHLAQMTTNQQALSEWTTICQGVYASFGASLPIENLTEASNETAKTGELTGALADALNWAGVSETAFAEQLALCNTEAEREKLIRETLNGLYSDASANYEANNAQVLAQREAQAQLNAQLAKIGEAMAPIITLFTQFATTLLEQLTPYVQQLAGDGLPQLESILNSVADAISAVIGWIVNNWELVSNVAIVVGVITGALAILSTTIGIVNAVMAMSPITWIIAGIVALIAVIALCVIYWDDIKEAGAKAWEMIKNAWDKAVGWFSGIFNSVKTAIGNAFTAIGNFGRNAWNTIKSAFSSIGSWFGSIFRSASTAVKNAFSGITGFFSGIWTSIKNIFSSVGSTIGDGIKGAVSFAVNGILGTATNIINGFINAINSVIGVINAIPGVSIGYISTLSVPAMAKGGVVDSATLAQIGENGTEAVVPLENNLGWLDKMAGMLSERMGGGGTPIVLQVDGKTFAQISCDSINDLTRHRGSIPLVLS